MLMSFCHYVANVRRVPVEITWRKLEKTDHFRGEKGKRIKSENSSFEFS